MADTFSKSKRSELMSRIRSKNTKPEVWVRKTLHGQGFRYRIHDSSLPGKPDMKLKKHNAIIQIHGCFWHGHHCHLYRPPKSRTSYWEPKITRNRERDLKNNKLLLNKGWRLLIIWECALKGKTKLNDEILIQKIERWIASEQRFMEIEGK